MLSERTSSEKNRAEKENYLAHQLCNHVKSFVQSSRQVGEPLWQDMSAEIDELIRENSELELVLQEESESRRICTVTLSNQPSLEKIESEMKRILEANEVLMLNHFNKIHMLKENEQNLRRDIGNLQMQIPKHQLGGNTPLVMKLKQKQEELSRLIKQRETIQSLHKEKSDQFSQMMAKATLMLEAAQGKIKSDIEKCNATVTNQILLHILRVYVRFLNVKASVGAAHGMLRNSQQRRSFAAMQDLVVSHKANLDIIMHQLQCPDAAKKTGMDMYELYTQLEHKDKLELMSKQASNEFRQSFLQHGRVSIVRHESKLCASEARLFNTDNHHQYAPHDSGIPILVNGRT